MSTAPYVVPRFDFGFRQNRQQSKPGLVAISLLHDQATAIMCEIRQQDSFESEMQSQLKYAQTTAHTSHTSSLILFFRYGRESLTPTNHEHHPSNVPIAVCSSLCLVVSCYHHEGLTLFDPPCPALWWSQITENAANLGQWHRLCE